MAKYTPPEQSKTMQWVDIIFVVAAIFLALWLPLQAGWAGVSRAIEKIDNPTWEALGQTPAQVEQWVKLGFADQVGSWDDARKALGEMTGLGPDAEVFKAKKQRGFFEYLEEASTETKLMKWIDTRMGAELNARPLFILPGATQF